MLSIHQAYLIRKEKDPSYGLRLALLGLIGSFLIGTCIYLYSKDLTFMDTPQRIIDRSLPEWSQIKRAEWSTALGGEDAQFAILTSLSTGDSNWVPTSISNDPTKQPSLPSDMTNSRISYEPLFMSTESTSQSPFPFSYSSYDSSMKATITLHEDSDDIWLSSTFFPLKSIPYYCNSMILSELIEQSPTSTTCDEICSEYGGTRFIDGNYDLCTIHFIATEVCLGLRRLNSELVFGSPIERQNNMDNKWGCGYSKVSLTSFLTGNTYEPSRRSLIGIYDNRGCSYTNIQVTNSTETTPIDFSSVQVSIHSVNDPLLVRWAYADADGGVLDKSPYEDSSIVNSAKRTKLIWNVLLGTGTFIGILFIGTIIFIHARTMYTMSIISSPDAYHPLLEGNDPNPVASTSYGKVKRSTNQKKKNEIKGIVI